MPRPSRGEIFDAVRAWVHESPLSLCTMGSDTCDNWELSDALTDIVTQAGTEFESLAVQRAAEISQRHAQVIQYRDAQKRKRSRRVR